MGKVLCVIDTQNDFIDGKLGNDETRAVVPKIIEKILSYHENTDNLIVATKDTHFGDYLDTLEGQVIPIRHCIHLSDGWEINKDISAALGKKGLIVTKTSFGSTGLAEIIRSHYHSSPIEIDEIEIVGVQTDISVISNAIIIKTILPNIKITVDASCCAGTSLEKHTIALMTMELLHINIINKEENND